MMKRTLTKKLAIAASASALAFGAAACQVEDGEGLDPAMEDPLLDDTEGDPLLEGDGSLEGEGSLEGDGSVEGDG